MQYLGIEYNMKHTPKLDQQFVPFGVWRAAYLKDVDCLEDIWQDFQNTMGSCRPVTWQTLRQEPFLVKLTGYLAKVIAPLL